MKNVSNSPSGSHFSQGSTAPQKQSRPITTTTTTTVTTTTTAVTPTVLDALSTTIARDFPAELQESEGTASSPTCDEEGFGRDVDSDLTDARARQLAQLSHQAKSIEQANREGQEALFKAIDANDPAKVLAVLLLSPRLNEWLEDGSTPLQLAVRLGKARVASYLLAHPEIEINKAGAHGLAPLHEAAQSGDVPMAALLLKQPKIRLNITTPSGATPYHLALQHGRTKVAQQLLDNGANTDLTMRDGYAPVHCACKAGSLPTLQWLLKQPSTLQRHGVPLPMMTILNQRTLDGSTPLLLGVQSGDRPLVAYLLKHPLVDTDVANSGGETPLHLAAKSGQTPMVELLLKSGKTDIEAVNNDGATPFFLAIQGGSLEIAKLLLPRLQDKGAYVNRPTNGGLKPLHAACFSGRVPIVQWLLEQPVVLQGKRKTFNRSTVLNQTTREGKTPLRLAVDANSYAMVQYLLAREVRPNKADVQGDTPLHAAVKAAARQVVTALLNHTDIDVNTTNSQGTSAFLLAVKNSDKEMCEELVAHGANVQQSDADGVSALHLVCEKQSLDLLDWLLKHPQLGLLGGKPRHISKVLNQRDHGGNTLWSYALGEGDAAQAVVKRLVEQKGMDLNLADVEGRTPMHMACGLGLLNIAEMLADNGADLDRIDANGATPLHMACEGGDAALVEWLLKRLAMPNGRVRDMPAVLNKATHDGKTALYLAAYEGHDKVVQVMLEQPGIRPNVAAADGTTALHVAIDMHHEDSFALLLQHRGIEVDPWSASHGTPFHLAILEGDLQSAEVLVSRGADINRPNPDGFTALHTACQEGDFRTVRWLLKRPEILLLNGSPRTRAAVLNQPAQTGETPLLLAVLSGNMDLVLYLLQDGAEPNHKGPNGMAPLHEATRLGHLLAVEALLKCANIDVLQMGPSGNTVLHFIGASEKARPLIAAYQKALDLETFGKLARTPNARGETPAALASATGQ